MSIELEYRLILKTATIAAGALGVPGAFSFGLDVAGMTGIWGTMIYSIAKKSNHEINRTFTAKIASRVLAGVSAYIGGSKLAVSLFHAIPFAGTFTAIGINSILNAFFTYKMGWALVALFEKDDFDLSDTEKVIASLLVVISVLPCWDDFIGFLSLVGVEQDFSQDGTIVSDLSTNVDSIGSNHEVKFGYSSTDNMIKDHVGYYYPSRSDYLAGTNRHVEA